ncbi:vitelline envelope sperm lysin receptor-like [Liolophura sinensis]|uniref:vitelline envelope sperm lysin receptor-like n=1 Tax=Liolophura sinensis TaxID=3198878 RepID=UPI0031585376
MSESETIGDWYLAPWEAQSLLGGNSSADFRLKVVDVLGNEITSDHISIGRKIRLMAEDTSGSIIAFRALSCAAQNGVSRYYILRAGCGDGLVFKKSDGFETTGNVVLSPYFEAFKLAGGRDTIEFECRFTQCEETCNGVR